MGDKTTKTNRVVLNLNQKDADELINFLESRDGLYSTKTLNRISKRLEWTINKQKFLDRCKYEGFTPTKEQIKTFKESLK
jgi:hypothetical protein